MNLKIRNANWKRLSIIIGLLACNVSFLLAQERMKVTGTVTDATGESLIGATVMEKGTKNGTVTDIDGNYAISVDKGSVLVFTYVGYATQEAKVTGNALNVVMKEDTQVLDDVVVVGYGVQKKSSVTGAISQMKASDMENRTVTSAQQALQGKTAGVQLISSSAGPGSSPTVRVRGYSSNAAAEPLFVVDGVRLSDISGVDPNDIESIEVLKDGASAAIYGAEAGNGVVLITTKKGKSGDGKISFDFQLAWQSLAHKPKLLNAQEYINYVTEGGNVKLADFQAQWDGVTDTDWQDVGFENSLMQKYNLSFTGGNDKGNYYLSLTYLDNNGIVTGNADTYQRLTATINGEYNIKSWLKVGTTNQIEKYNYRTLTSGSENGSVFPSIVMMDPLTAVTYSPDNLPSHMQDAITQGHTLLTDADGNYYGVSRWYQGNNFNPLVMTRNNNNRHSGFNVNGSIYGDFKPFKGFTFTSRFGYRLSGTRASVADLPFYGNSMKMRDYTDYNSTSSTTIYYQWENFANYTKTFNEDHTLTAMAGMSYQESSYQYVYGGLTADGEDAVMKNDPLFYYLNYANASAIKELNGEKTRTSKLSYFGRVGYNYKNRYMVQASLRADGADLSILPASRRWGYYPAVSAGWNISEEPFFMRLTENSHILTNLKLRGSWGQNGSLSSLGGYLYSTDMAIGYFYPFVPGNNYTTAAAPTSLGNDKLKWETSEQWNVGIDARFLNGALTFSMDYFNKDTKDLLVRGTTPSLTLGGTVSPINAGNVNNRGFEFELGWRGNVKDFKYTVSANLATLKNKVTYLDPSLARVEGTRFTQTPISFFEKGYPVYYFRGYKFAGLDENGDPLFADLSEGGTPTASPDNTDLTYIGDGIPDFTYGITLTAEWRGLDFTLFGTGSQGNKIYHASYRTDYPTANVYKDIFYDNRWTPDNPDGSVPRACANRMAQYIRSDAMVYDGSYFKIKQIQLGYSLPKSWLKKAYISNLRIYCSLDDFFTFTKYPGFDPEASANATSGMGIDKGSYPTSKKVVFGLNLSF